MNIFKPTSVGNKAELVVNQTALLVQSRKTPISSGTVCYLHLEEKDDCCCEHKNEAGKVEMLRSFYESISVNREAKREIKLYDLDPNVKERVKSFESIISNN